MFLVDSCLIYSALLLTFHPPTLRPPDLIIRQILTLLSLSYELPAGLSDMCCLMYYIYTTL